MGIYVQSFADLPPSPPEEWPARVQMAASAWAADAGLAELFYASVRENSVWLSFYPPCGGIAFEVSDGRLSFDAKTSIGGPGFHAALIDLCDAIQRELGVTWRWDAGGDEVGFAQHRDFGALREAFVQQFEAFCDFYRQHHKAGQLHALNLAEGLAIDGYEGIATPMGPLPVDFFLSNTSETSAENAAAIFPWWDSAIDAEFWRWAAIAMLWSEVEWRSARGPWERHVQAATLRAAGHVPAAPELEPALTELRLIQSQSEDTFRPPTANGIGWTRRTRAYFLPGPWRINLPGYYLDQIEDDGGTTCVWFGDEEVRGSSFTVTPKKPGEIGWSEDFAEAPEHKAATHRFRLNPMGKESSQDGFWLGFAECQALDSTGQGHILVLSLTSSTKNLLPRLEALARSVWFAPPRDLPSATRDA